MNTVVIDGDEIAYKLAFRFQDIEYHVLNPKGEYIFSEGTKDEAIADIGTTDEEFSIVKKVIPLDISCLNYHLDELHTKIKLATNSDKSIFMLSGKSNFRYGLATLLPYKGDRSKDDKPYYLEYIKDYISKNYNYRQTEWLEADDLLSIWSSMYKDIVVASTDKDLRTVPSINYNIMRDHLQVIDEHKARYNFYTQLALGDSTDNIPSPFNLGEKTVEKVYKGMLEGKASDLDYYQTLLPVYMSYLKGVDKEGKYKTKWYKDQDINSIHLEIGNLLWMKRSFDTDLEWKIPT